MSRLILGLFLGAVLTPASTSAQTNTAVVFGSVTDAQKAVLPGVRVTGTNVDTGTETVEVTDDRGRFRLGGLRPGTYDIRADIQGFSSQVKKGMQLFLGQEATIDFELAVASVVETLTVTASAPLVEVTKSEVSSVVDRRQLDALPLADRNFANLTRLTPGVVGADLIGGQQSTTSNTYVIDGVSNDRAWTGGNRTGYSVEAIREFRVITQQYAAEFGQASGGVINVVTRSGTNTFENRLFAYERADELDANNYFATAEAPFSRQQFGGFSGGPISRNRLFYFGAYEGIRQDRTVVVNTPVERDNFPQPTRTHQQFGKVDYQIASPHLLTLRFTEEGTTISNSGVGGGRTVGNGLSSKSRSHDFYGGLTSVIGSSRLNELRVQIARRPASTVPNTPSGPELLFASSSQGKPYSEPQSTTETRFEIVDNFSWHTSGRAGEHDVKLGFDLNRESLFGFFCNFCDGQFTFPGDVYDPNDRSTFPTNYTRRLGSSEFTIPDRVYSAFVQDSWRPRPNVTINGGVRFDRAAYARQLVTNDVSPRLAVSLDPNNSGRTVVRAGGGLFRDKISLNQWLIIVLNVINATDFVVITNPGYPDPTGGRPAAQGPPNTERFDPGMQTPYASQATAGVKRDLGGGFAVSADYLYVRGFDQLRRRDLNAPRDGTTVRPDPTIGRVLLHESTGDRNYHALILAAERRFANRWRFTSAYTLSRSRSNSEARNTTTLPTNQYDLDADWGPADNDARHNFVATGQITLPFDVHLAGILQVRSAFPFNVVSGRDTNNDSRSGDRPDPNPIGPFPTNGVSAYGRFSIPVNRPGTLTRNAFRGPDFRSADLRLSKVVPLGRRKIELLAEGFNITNRVNFNGYQGSIQSRLFGMPQSAGDARQVQLGARFDF
jgi:Carboxypeptidase regulatory-like domain